MAFVSLRQVLGHAAEHGYGVPAFNVNNLEQVQTIMEAAQETDSPVVLQTSAGARKYAGAACLRHLMLAAAKLVARGIVKARFEAFGCAGQGGRIKPVPLEAMAGRYR